MNIMTTAISHLALVFIVDMTRLELFEDSFSSRPKKAMINLLKRARKMIEPRTEGGVLVVSDADAQTSERSFSSISDTSSTSLASPRSSKSSGSSRQYPPVSYFSSIHVMVNEERFMRLANPLVRSPELDSVAREQAEAMAERDKLFHSDPSLLLQLQNVTGTAHRFGENVGKGRTVRDIHERMMKTRSQRNNILHGRFTHMGMATAKASDGELFLCQVFVG